MTLRLQTALKDELRETAEDERRSVHQTVVHAIETYLSLRETDEIKADPDTLRALAEAQEGIKQGDVVYGSEAVHTLAASTASATTWVEGGR